MTTPVPTFTVPRSLSIPEEKKEAPTVKTPRLRASALSASDDHSHLALREEEKNNNKLVIVYSRDIPQNVHTLFKSLGKVVDFSYKIHGSYSLRDIQYNYLYIDIRDEQNRIYLKLHRQELQQIDSLAFGHKIEFEAVEERSDAWWKACKKAISHFDSLLGHPDELQQVLFNDKLKFCSLSSSLLKKVMACFGAH